MTLQEEIAHYEFLAQDSRNKGYINALERFEKKIVELKAKLRASNSTAE